MKKMYLYLVNCGTGFERLYTLLRLLYRCNPVVVQEPDYDRRRWLRLWYWCSCVLVVCSRVKRWCVLQVNGRCRWVGPGGRAPGRTHWPRRGSGCPPSTTTSTTTCKYIQYTLLYPLTANQPFISWTQRPLDISAEECKLGNNIQTQTYSVPTNIVRTCRSTFLFPTSQEDVLNVIRS